MSEVLKCRMRSAVYTRKSTDEGLEQEYNSIAAQRDAAAIPILPASGLRAGFRWPTTMTPRRFPAGT